MRQPLGPALAVGAQLKSAVAISVGQDAILSQHLGDLGSAPAFENFSRAIDDLSALYAHKPERGGVRSCIPTIARPAAPPRSGLPVVGVQHHYAHILSCMTENEIDPPVLGVAWDGTGWGVDGTVWGGEFLRVPARGFERVGHLRTFGLPGSEKAVVEPRRAALGVLFEIYGADLPRRPRARPLVVSTRARDAHRDAGEAAPHAAHLERRAPVRCRGGTRRDSPDVHVRGTGRDGARVVARRRSRPRITTTSSGEDWEPIVRGIVGDVRRGVAVGRIAARFHNSLTEMIVRVATRVGEEKVALSGGCFQNRALAEAHGAKAPCGRLPTVLASARAAQRWRDRSRSARGAGKGMNVCAWPCPGKILELTEDEPLARRGRSTSAAW